MSKTVTISFAGKRPCKDCGSTTSVRGWCSRTDEVTCMRTMTNACEKRQLTAWRAKHPDCYDLGHRPEPGGFCSACRPMWAGGPIEERICPECNLMPCSDKRATCLQVKCQQAAKRRARAA